MTALPTDTEVSRALWSTYRPAPPAQRLLAALRPFICPLGPILSRIPAAERVLDIGCGNGVFLTTLSRFGDIEHGWGVDLSAPALACATRVAATNRLPLTFARAPTFDEWPAGPFDIVSMVDVMHHLPSDLRRRFVQEALARVKPGGAFVYKDMCSRPNWRVAWNTCHDLVLARQWVKVEPIANVIAWAREAGFDAVERDNYVATGVYGHELAVFRARPTAAALQGQ